MQNKPLQIVSVFDDNVVYAEHNNTMQTLDYANIHSLNFARVISDNIIQANMHDASVILLDNGNADHNLGQTFQTWINKNHRQTLANKCHTCGDDIGADGKALERRGEPWDSCYCDTCFGFKGAYKGSYTPTEDGGWRPAKAS